MSYSESPYRDINIFPWLSPLAIMLCADLIEAFYGAQLPKGVHEAVVTIATIFTYGILFISPISYVSFKHIILPALNILHGEKHINSYFINVIVVLITTEIGIVLVLGLFSGFGNIASLFTVAAIPTSLVALNCFGHILFFTIQSWAKRNA